MDEGSSNVWYAQRSGATIRVALLAVVAAAALWAVSAEWSAHVAGQLRFETPVLLRSVATVVFVGGGLLHWVRWRLSRAAESARAAVVLFALAAAVAAVPSFGANLAGVSIGDRSADSMSVRILVRVLLLALVGCALWAGHTRPLPVAGSVLLTWGVLVGVALPLALPAGNLLAGRPLAIALETLATAGWLFLLLVRCRRTVGPPPALEIVLPVLLGASEIARAWSVSHPEIGPLPALALQTAAAGVAAALAGRTLYRRVLSTQPSVRAHDSRSALAAVAAATDVLATLATTGRPQNRGEDIARDVDRLHGLVRAEMGRIERVLLGERAVRVDFDLTQALSPVLLAHTLAGGRGALSTDLGDAHGDPWTTAAVVDAALANVRAHAPGASVSIGLERRGAHVRIVIDDDGPGIDPRERAQVLGYGVRGSLHGPGSGIGLYSAAQAMADQGGRLELADSPGGGVRVVLTLPGPATAVCAMRRAS